jgi:hypothetical protein
MSDTELTVSHPLRIRVDLTDLDFNRLVEAIRVAATQACDELWGRAVRAVERLAQQRQPDRWVNRGKQTRRLRLPWGEVAIRQTRVRDQFTGKTYNLGDRVLGLSPYVRRGLHEIRTACELAVSMSYRLAWYWWQRLTGRRCSLKKQGMSWSTAGAGRLSKLRALFRDTDRWEAFWSRASSLCGD